MAELTPEEWRTLSVLLDEALELDDDARATWLAQLERSAPARAVRVRELLLARDAISREGFLCGTATPPPVSGGRSGDQFGPYQLDTLVGRGGMGSVWLARRIDGRYDARVAVKLLTSSVAGTDGARRFRREGQILARLTHPNIAHLLDAGVTTDDRPYLVLEYVDGFHIDQWCRERALDVRGIVRLFLDVLGAVAHAHAALVVHRDLKPSNVLVDVDGRVKLLDFGIAKLVEDDSAPAVTVLTQDGNQLLTPLYASPEQVTGGAVTTAADIYALGVLLFELLTDARPYRLARDSRGALEEAIVSSEPLRPSECAHTAERRRVLRGDLDTIVLKALRKRPSDRYTTVQALADDLQAWLDGRPVRARPQALGYRTVRFIRRNRLAVGAAAAVVLAVAGGALVALQQARVARAEAARAQEVTAFISGIFRDADPYLGNGEPLSAPDLLKQAYARLDTSLVDRPDLRYELIWLIGSSLTALQAYQSAAPMLHEAETIASARYQPTDERRLRAQLALSGLYRALGKLDSMDTVLGRTLATVRGAPPKDASLLVGALIDSAHLAIDRGAAAAAVSPAREADSLAQQLLPPGHELRVMSVQILAVALENLGQDPAEVLRVAERAVTTTQARYGGLAAHPRVIEGEMVLGRALGRVGRTRDAIAVLDRADSNAQTSMGRDAFTRAFIMGSRGNYRMELSEFPAALADYDEARRILWFNGDSTSVSYGIVQGNRGNILVQMGHGAQALAPLEEALRLLTAAYGPGHPRLTLHGIRLAHALALAGRPADAERRLRAAARDSTVPTTTRALLRQTQGVVSRLRGDPVTAAAHHHAALALVPDSTSVAGQRTRAPMWAELARTLRLAGNLAGARAAAVRAREAYRAAGVSELPPRMADALAGMP